MSEDEARPAGVEAANETSVEAVNETAAEAAIETRMQSIEADFVTARERHTKKAAEVETNAHSTRGICEHTG